MEYSSVEDFLLVEKTGMYSVSYSLTVWDGTKGEKDYPTLVYIRKNEKKVPGTIHDSDIAVYNRNQPSNGLDIDVGHGGGMHLFMELEKGDKLDLYCERCRKIAKINFCMNLEYII